MKIFVAIDPQKDFISGVLGSEEAKIAAHNLANRINEVKQDPNCEIIYTTDAHDDNYLKTYEGTILPIPHCIYDTDGIMLEDEIDEALPQDCLEFEKHTFGTFKIGEDFMTFYDSRNIESIEVCGFCTDICVITNVLILRTYFPNIPIYVRADCCAGSTPLKHNAALEVMKSCQITII